MPKLRQARGSARLLRACRAGSNVGPTRAACPPTTQAISSPQKRPPRVRLKASREAPGDRREDRKDRVVLEQFPPFPPILATRIGWDLLGNIDMNLGMDEGGILREEEEEEEEEDF